MPETEPESDPAEEADLQEELLDWEFIEDWEEPASHKFGVYEIRKFKILPHYVVIFSYHLNTAGQKKPFYQVKVIYEPRPNVKSSSKIKLHVLPTQLLYMVYFIRRFLKVYKQGYEIDYACFTGWDKNVKIAFTNEMKRLYKKLKAIREEEEKKEEKAQESEEDFRKMITEGDGE